MILGHLKQKTSGQHKILEKLFYQDKILNYSLSKVEYKELLLVNLLVHSHLEEALEKGLSKKEYLALELKKRRKTSWLLQDLKRQGINGEKFLNETTLASKLKVNNVKEALGVLYVTEGSTLGGKFILRKLVLNPTLKFISEFIFFRGYEGSTGQYWREIQDLLNSQEVEHPDTSSVINKANETFSYFISVAENYLGKSKSLDLISKYADKETSNTARL
ncbi:MAG: biliverdin-producing heme oxygenase [Flammeovirgaceae bacterium]|nr:biliverdin-producing heme oxygenase [Flammeovirgaceae bacterium]